VSGNLIRLFLVDGKANGMRTVEISNMTIHGTIFPRTQTERFGSRDMANKPGVYLLLGADIEDPEQTVLYVGEGDPVFPRLKSHANNKDFWTEAMIFSSKDDYLSKTQIKFLEAELVNLAKEAKRVRLDNSQTPTKPNISEVDKAEVSQYLDAVLLIVTALGYDIFEPRTVNAAQTGMRAVFELEVKGAKALMEIIDDQYVVLRGSTAVRENRPSIPPAIAKMRNALLEMGVMVEQGDYYVFKNDAPFNSPSYAASAVVGGAANGRKLWKHDGKALKTIQS